jgi:hypothetical protein
MMTDERLAKCMKAMCNGVAESGEDFDRSEIVYAALSMAAIWCASEGMKLEKVLAAVRAIYTAAKAQGRS